MLRRKFTNRYERMAYVTLEYIIAARTYEDIGREVGLSYQRVLQIVKAGCARAGCRNVAVAREDTNKLRTGFMLVNRAAQPPEPNTPEWFYWYEQRHLGP